MPVHEVWLGKEGEDSRAVEVWPSSAIDKRIDIDFSALQGAGNRAADEATIIQLIQLGLDTRQRVNQLPNDDPDKDADPGRDNLYWGDADGTPNPSGGNRWLIGRGVVCTGAPWDIELNRYNLELRAAHSGPIGT